MIALLKNRLFSLTVGMGLLFGLSPTASAQAPADWQFVAGPVFSAQPAIPFMSQSVGAPAVVYDSIRNRFMMFFETRTPNVDARCPQGVWGIGAATSPDGVTWTAVTNPVYRPTPGTARPFSCVAAQPSAVFSPTAFAGNGGVLIIFKAEQGTDACNVVVPSWGCQQYTGFGRMQVRLNVAGDIQSVTVGATPVLKPTTATYGFAKLVQDGGLYRMLYQGDNDIWRTGASTLSFTPGFVEMDTSAIAGTLPWVTDQMYNPALLCSDDPVFDYATFVGGRDIMGPTVLSGGWGKAIDQVWNAGPGFAIDVTAQQTFVGNDAWRHWDMHRTTTGEYLVWFSEKDGLGNSFIRFGTTDPAFVNNTVAPKQCP